MKKLRVGFLLDDLCPNQYVADLISFVSDNENFDTPVLITGYKVNSRRSFFGRIIGNLKLPPSQFVDNLIRSISMRLIRNLELKSVVAKFPKYICKVNLTDFNNYELVKVVGTWSKSGLFLEFTSDDLTLISKNNLDCIIRCGSGILRGHILSAIKFGVISIHHGDNRVNRGGPSGFWEVLNGEPSSGFVIQRLNQELDGGEILARGNVMTANRWFANNAQLLEKSNVFLMKLLTDLSVNRKLPQAEGVRLHGNRLYKIESSTVLVKYLLTIVLPQQLNGLMARIHSPYTHRWSIAYAQHKNHSKSLWRYNEIKNPKGRFLADPFVFNFAGSNYIFVEDLFYSDNKGRISAIRVDSDGYEFLGVVLEEDFHLSFPFVFKEGEDIYMIPESSKNHDIRLYKCVDFPNHWALDTIIMSDVSAADTMLLKKNGTCFLLTNICSVGHDDHQSELHIFFSNNFKATSWQPIGSGNPVIFDSQRARNGGLFFHNGVLYRVNQVHGQEHYGKAFGVNEVLKISENEYVEERVSNVDPNFMDKIISTHHFSANESLAAVDFARKQRLRIALRT